MWGTGWDGGGVLGHRETGTCFEATNEENHSQCTIGVSNSTNQAQHEGVWQVDRTGPLELHDLAKGGIQLECMWPGPVCDPELLCDGLPNLLLDGRGRVRHGLDRQQCGDMRPYQVRFCIAHAAARAEADDGMENAQGSRRLTEPHTVPDAERCDQCPCRQLVKPQVQGVLDGVVGLVQEIRNDAEDDVQIARTCGEHVIQCHVREVRFGWALEFERLDLLRSSADGGVALCWQTIPFKAKSHDV